MATQPELNRQSREDDVAPSVPLTSGETEATRPVEPTGTSSSPESTEGPAESLETPGGVLPGRSSGFEVHLDNFDGPFDLLLGLISKHKLDVTEIAISQVTDDFLAYVKAMGSEWDLGEVSEFLLVAATLLDLKAARLLPAAEVEDDEDLALLEARDLLFARLLQYRAFKDVASTLAQHIETETRRAPRDVAIEEHLTRVLPELVLGLTPLQFAEIAAKALTPKEPPKVRLDHLHNPAVSVREQAALIVGRLRQVQTASFRSLVSDADGKLVVIARFLALLELFREAAVAFDQVSPLGELTVRWTGAEIGEIDVDEFEGVEVVTEAEADPSGFVTEEDLRALSS
ncbi:segregation and condensation protein A [Kineosporia succinea]|uniref:Segregation and condensation protein A n=1 Tax=Kineosporia succinea TaxID=84632 RepID=A0ABT9P6P0_9ACTN|nr:segregation/condensation protein A [Kineosporia succinea]MDP9828367.1 segregation and condensation protein A [Kineosporia succinea]